MSSNPNWKLRLACAGMALTLVAPACGDDDDDVVDDPDSAFCETAREWAVYSFDSYDTSDPAAFRAYWNEYTAFLEASVETAPGAIREAEELNEKAIRETFTPILEKYDFDLERMMNEGTEEEARVFDEPPAEVVEAQAVIHAYESRVCGTEEPAAADVTFEEDARSEEYCEATFALHEAYSPVFETDFSPGALEEFATADTFEAMFEARRDAAPEALGDDIEPVTGWWIKQWRDVLAEWDYDLRALVRDGTPEDRANLMFTNSAISEHYARVEAYEAQFCSE